MLINSVGGSTSMYVLNQFAFRANQALNPIIDWPYCNAAKRLSSVLTTNSDSSAWGDLQWRRRLETFGDNDTPVLSAGPNGEVDGIW